MSIFDAGAAIVPDFITDREEERLIQRIEEAPWLSDLSRRVQHYGYRYDYKGTSQPVPATPFPRWATVMAERLRTHFGGTVPVQCIVNEYRPAQGIGMHADHADFGPIVASLSLSAAWPMRFRQRSVRPYRRDGAPGDEVAILPRRSVLVLRGAARTAWMHGIDPADTRPERTTRLSATFRTLAHLPPAR